MTVVWHLSSNRWNSAITEYALSCARACELAGARSIFSPLAGSPAEARGKAAGLRVVPFGTFGMSLANLPYREQLGVLKPDVIVTYGGNETVLSMVHGHARVFRFRGQALDSGSIAKMKHKLSHMHIAGYLAPSAALTRELKALSPDVPAHHVVLGIADGRFMLPPQPPPRRTPPEIVLLGRFDPVKGHAEAFQLHRMLLDRWREGPKPVLHIVGEPANLSVAHLEQIAAKERLSQSDYKITARRVEDVPALLSGAVLGLVSSTGSEIIGRVAEEFLLCGTPVALSGAGSLNELLFDGAGFSYRGLAPDETATRLVPWIERSIAESPAARQARSATAKERYSLPAMARGLKVALQISSPSDEKPHEHEP